MPNVDVYINVDDPELNAAFPKLQGMWKPDDKDVGWVTSEPWSVRRGTDRWYVHIKQGHIEVCEFRETLEAARNATLEKAIEACRTYMRDFDDDIAAAYARIEKLRIDQKATTETLGEILGMKADFTGVPAQEDQEFENSAENACDICHTRPRSKQCMCRAHVCEVCATVCPQCAENGK